MSEAKLEAYFFTAVLVAVLGVVAYIFYPFLNAIAVALVLATLTNPLYTAVNHRVKRAGLASLIVVALVTLAILLPAIGLFMLLLQEVQGIAHSVASLDMSGMPAFLDDLWQKAVAVVPLLARVDLTGTLEGALSALAGNLGGALASTADAVLQLLVAIVALYYFLRDGRRFLSGFIALSPLSDDEDVQIVKKLQAVTYSLIRGQLVIALLQGVLVGLGLLVFGVPNPVLWGAVAAVASLIPTLGTGMVTVPSTLYLIFTGQWAAAIGFAAWAFLLVGLIDNFLGPKLIGSHAALHPLFVLLSVMGGVAVFGVVGFLIGPLLFGLLVALSEIYRVKIKEIHRQVLE
jgi:predicted PurR-regulated permease PerM